MLIPKDSCVRAYEQKSWLGEIVSIAIRFIFPFSLFEACVINLKSKHEKFIARILRLLIIVPRIHTSFRTVGSLLWQ